MLIRIQYYSILSQLLMSLLFESIVQVSSTELEILDVAWLNISKIRIIVSKSKEEYEFIHIDLVQLGLIPSTSR